MLIFVSLCSRGRGHQLSEGYRLPTEAARRPSFASHLRKLHAVEIAARALLMKKCMRGRYG